MLEPVAFADIKEWATDNHGAALAALARHASDLPTGETYRKGSLGIAPEGLLALSRKARTAAAAADPRRFFEENFVACRIMEPGKVTAFYEPEINAVRTADERYRTPFLRRPADLVAVNEQNAPLHWATNIRFARLQPDGLLSVYHDRAAIENGALADQKLEIAYVDDPVDAFFAHIQGAARLRFSDGTVTRITYDGKSGHPFTGIGSVLVREGAMTLAEASMQAIRGWLAANPLDATAIMQRNRSYIFFRETDAGNRADGPVAAAKIPLTAGRSLAVDRLIHTFATPIFVDATNVNGGSFRRLMIAQETGTAIVGPVRGDLFMGSGNAAGELAGHVNSPCTFIVLVPRTDPLLARLSP